jgi:hypothetical protein
MFDGSAALSWRALEEVAREERAREIFIRLAIEIDERADERLQSLKGATPPKVADPTRG